MAERYIGENTPKLGFGFMRVPIKPKKGSNWTEGTLDFDYEKTCEMVDYFMANGFNTYHTAWAYEGNEEFLRETVVKRYPRDSFEIVDNLPVHVIDDPAMVAPTFQESLEHLGVDCIDYLLLHMLNQRLSERCEKTGVWDFVSKMKAEGKVKHIGFSFHDTPEQLDAVLTNHPEVDVVQLQINYADWETEMPAARRCYEIAWLKHKKPFFIMEPVKGGILGADVDVMREVFEKINPGDSNARWALRFVLGLDGLISAFSGMSSMDQMIDNVETAKNYKPLSDEEKKALDEVTEKLKKVEAYQCTHCRYCIPLCPMEISCCDMIDCVNDAVTYKLIGKAKHHYDFITGHEIGRGKPGTCVECGACEGHCPQHLPISKIMLQAHELFEDPDLVVDQA